MTQLLELFIAGFGLNILWEFSHCQLYETCRRQSWKKNVPLLIIMSAKDAFWIAVFSSIAAFVFQIDTIMQNPYAITLFILFSLTFSFLDEKISLHLNRWQYTPSMPTIFGVGVTPLLEIALTGLAANVIVNL